MFGFQGKIRMPDIIPFENQTEEYRLWLFVHFWSGFWNLLLVNIYIDDLVIINQFS